MFKKTLIFLLFVFAFTLSGQSVLAQASPAVNVYFFWGDGCPHCAKEEIFLEILEEKYSKIKVYDFEVWKSAPNRNLLAEVGKKLNTEVSGVPFTVVGNQYFVGYFNDQTTGKEIENAALDCLANQCSDIVAPLAGITPPENIEKSQNNSQSSIPQNIREKIINLPFLGEIDAMNFSLPILTIIMGALDGFNPCAMWTLLFLISLLLGMNDRKKMWILGTTFIVASASVYFVFMAAWLNLILFIGVVFWVRILIGLVALAGGGYNLKEYFTTPEAVCKVTDTDKRQKFFERLKNIAHHPSFLLAFGGIILLAFAVNLVELICSAGLPAVYTQILALNDLTKLQYYFYILFYIFIFMLDDLLVFFAAMITLRMTGITTKYSHWSHLIGGVLMIIIGLLLIFKPELLMLG